MKSVFVLVLFFCFIGSAAAKTAADNNCLELLQARCQKCHYLERVCKQVEERSKRRWKATLTRMVKRRGAEVTAREQKRLLDCLAAPDPGIVNECNKK